MLCLRIDLNILMTVFNLPIKITAILKNCKVSFFQILRYCNLSIAIKGPSYHEYATLFGKLFLPTGGV